MAVPLLELGQDVSQEIIQDLVFIDRDRPMNLSILSVKINLIFRHIIIFLSYFFVSHFLSFFRPPAETMITAPLPLSGLETNGRFPELGADQGSPNRIRCNDHSPCPSIECTSRAGSGHSDRRTVACPIARPTTPLLLSKAGAFGNAHNRGSGRSPHSNS